MVENNQNAFAAAALRGFNNKVFALADNVQNVFNLKLVFDCANQTGRRNTDFIGQRFGLNLIVNQRV